jgi:uncharacterized membrane protein YbhN (UPF0104 family)
MRSAWRRWLWLLVGAIVIVLIFYNLRRSPDWQKFSWQELWQTITSARLGLLGIALVAVYATYFMRAYRWKFFLDPIKKASLWVMFVGQVLGFSSIYLVGRPGEFVRPAYIAKREKVPMSAMMGVWMLERVFDSVFLLFLFAAGVYFEPLGPASAHRDLVLAWLHKGGYVMFAIAAGLVAGLVLFRLRTRLLTGWALRILGFLPTRALRQIEHFLHSFAEALGVIRSWSVLTGSVITTVVLWVMNATVFWLVFKSLGGELARLPWLAAGLTLFCAALGLVVQFPGIGGGYQVGTILALSEIFNVATAPATGAGILIWIVMSVPCLALGLVLLIGEGLTFRKLEEIAKEEEAEAGIAEV